MPIPKPNQENLRDITEIKVCATAGDANNAIACGGVLVSVAALRKDKERGTFFRFAIGWPAAAGEPSEKWTSIKGSR